MAKWGQSFGPLGPDIPPIHGGDSCSFGQFFLVHTECWRLCYVSICSQLVACRWAGRTQTIPHLGNSSPPRVRTTPLIYCCLEENVLCPNFYFMVPLCSYTATFLQRSICRNAGCNRKLWNEKNGDSVSLLGNQDSAQKLNLFWKSLNWWFPAPGLISPPITPSLALSSSLSVSCRLT